MLDLCMKYKVIALPSSSRQAPLNVTIHYDQVIKTSLHSNASDSIFFGNTKVKSSFTIDVASGQRTKICTRSIFNQRTVITQQQHSLPHSAALLPRATSSSDSITHTSAIHEAKHPQKPSSPGELWKAMLSDGNILYFETVQPSKTKRTKLNSSSNNSAQDYDRSNDTIIEALCQGELVTINLTNLTVEHKGHWPRVTDSWVKPHTILQNALKTIRQSQKEGLLPSQLLHHHGHTSFCYVTSLDEFEEHVARHPHHWCTGTGKCDQPPSTDQTALLTAGEMLAFLSQYRGIVLVQLMMQSLDSTGGLPLKRPFVLTLLKRALEDKMVAAYPSVVPGGLAGSFVLAAKQQPFKSWGEYLAKIHVQASLVADSPYYKCLIGRILGYKEEHIVDHIESFGGRLEPHVAAAVDEELLKISAAPPRLPWKRK